MKKNEIIKILGIAISAFSVSGIFVGCSSSTNKTTFLNKERKERVVLSNLLLNINNKQPKLSKKNIVQTTRKKYQIYFDNDSYKLNPKVIENNLSQIKNLVKKHNMSVIITGHSHGISNVGIRELSTKRSNAVYFYLISKGFDRQSLKRYATWSGTNEKGVMQKGVEIVLNIPEKNNIKTFVKN